MDDFERILSAPDGIEPSSGFAGSVMAAVRREADEPPPLPFPWLRFAAGVAACGIVAAAGTVIAPRAWPAVVATGDALSAVAPELSYAAVALALTLAAVRLPRLLASR